MMKCLLCQSTQVSEFEKLNDISFWSCTMCSALFKHPRHHVSTSEEKQRYLLHTNDVKDQGYRQFVRPIVERIYQEHLPKSKGLDFGSGNGPVASKMLNELGYSNIVQYDPFFHPEESLLATTYNFIICIEVVEHFYHPLKEFKLLYHLLEPGGTLYIMTHLLPDLRQLKDWYYKNDKTHVFFYHEMSLQWIQEHLGFRTLEIANRCIMLTK